MDQKFLFVDIDTAKMLEWLADKPDDHYDKVKSDIEGLCPKLYEVITQDETVKAALSDPTVICVDMQMPNKEDEPPSQTRVSAT